MRVIAGSARSVQLKTPPGMATRPTTDIIKETLFNMLQFDIPGCIFLDMFAGSGGIGIEALSRGAARAYFVDVSPVPVAIIGENLRKCHLEDRAVVLKGDAVSQTVRILSDMKQHLTDGASGTKIVFLDPPYDKGLEFPVIKALDELQMIDEDTIIVVETSLKGDLSAVSSCGLEIYKEKIYKNQKHTFLRKA